MYLINGTSGTGTFVSATYPASSVTFPTGYRTYARRIGSFNTTAAGAPIPYTSIEAEGGATINWLTTQIRDISTTTLSTTRIAYTLTVPSGIKVQPLYRATCTSGGTNEGVLFTSGDETDVAAGSYTWSTAPGADLWTNSGAGVSVDRDGMLTTNTSGQIGARASSASATMYWVTRGFKDFRRN